MPRKLKPFLTVMVCVAALGTEAHSDEEMDRVFAEAMPHMHHSCESVIESFGDDQDQISQVVRLMAMVSLYNRQIDVLSVVPDEAERAELKDEFVEELEDACDDDPGRLLAGAVDIAVKDTIDSYD